MARGKNRHQNSKNCDGESVPTQTGQEEEIASPSPSPCTSPRRGIPEEKEGMNERDLSQKSQPRCTSLQRGTPDATEGIYPADTSRKDSNWQIGHQDPAAAAILVQRHLCLLLTILGYHHPPKHNYCRKNILRKKKTVNYFLSVFFQNGTKTLLFLRGYRKIIVMKLIYLPLLQHLNSQRLFKKQSFSLIMTALILTMTMAIFRTLRRP